MQEPYYWPFRALSLLIVSSLRIICSQVLQNVDSALVMICYTCSSLSKPPLRLLLNYCWYFRRFKFIHPLWHSKLLHICTLYSNMKLQAHGMFEPSLLRRTSITSTANKLLILPYCTVVHASQIAWLADLNKNILKEYCKAFSLFNSYLLRARDFCLAILSLDTQLFPEKPPITLVRSTAFFLNHWYRNYLNSTVVEGIKVVYFKKSVSKLSNTPCYWVDEIRYCFWTTLKVLKHTSWYAICSVWTLQITASTVL